MTNSRQSYQNQIALRTQSVLIDLIDEAHVANFNEAKRYLEIVKDYMNVTGDGMKRYYEGKNYSTVTMNYGNDADRIKDFLNVYETEAKILWIERSSGHIQIAFYWKSEMERKNNYRVSIRRNSVGIIQDIPKHTLTFDERIVTGHEDGYKAIFDEYENAKVEWKATVAARKLREAEKAKITAAEQIRLEKEARDQRILNERLRQIDRLRHDAAKRVRRCGVTSKSIHTVIEGTPMDGILLYDVDELLRSARTNSSELNGRLQTIKALAAYARFIRKPLYVEEIQAIFPGTIDEIIAESK